MNPWPQKNEPYPGPPPLRRVGPPAIAAHRAPKRGGAVGVVVAPSAVPLPLVRQVGLAWGLISSYKHSRTDRPSPARLLRAMRRGWGRGGRGGNARLRQWPARWTSSGRRMWGRTWEVNARRPILDASLARAGVVAPSLGLAASPAGLKSMHVSPSLRTAHPNPTHRVGRTTPTASAPPNTNMFEGG